MTHPIEIALAVDFLVKRFGPNHSAVYVPAEDESVDDCVQILKDGKDTGLELQIGAGYLGVGWMEGEGDNVLMYDLYDGNNLEKAFVAITEFIKGGWKV